MTQAIPSKLNISGCFDSRTGGRDENQDSAGVAETPLGTLVLVCDGMGGAQGGSSASMLAVSTISDYVSKADGKDNAEKVLAEAIKEANRLILAEGNANIALKGMGTTVTAILLSERCATVAHVGDSRIYQLRKGKKVFRTFDHSMVFEMVRKKVLTEEQARLSAQSNVILRAVGIKDDVTVETHVLPYRKGDRFVLCSDGFWGVMPEDDLIMHLSSDNPVEKILISTCNTVEAVARKKGAEYDNLTAAIIEMNQGSSLGSAMTLRKWLAILAVVALLLTLVFFLLAGQKDTGTRDKDPARSGSVDLVFVPGGHCCHSAVSGVSPAVDSGFTE